MGEIFPGCGAREPSPKSPCLDASTSLAGDDLFPTLPCDDATAARDNMNSLARPSMSFMVSRAGGIHCKHALSNGSHAATTGISTSAWTSST